MFCFEAHDPQSFLPFRAYCVMEEVRERLAPAALPAPVHSSSSASSPCDISRPAS